MPVVIGFRKLAVYMCMPGRVVSTSMRMPVSGPTAHAAWRRPLSRMIKHWS